MSRPLLGGALIIIFAIGLLTYDSYLGLFHGPYIGHISHLCLNLSICLFFCSLSLPPLVRSSLHLGQLPI